MSTVFFLSDLHFGHKRIIQFGRNTGIVYRSGEDYLENMENIIKKWNSVVTKRDKVFVLGDVAFNQEGYEGLFRLNGKKTLIRGNHDEYFSTEDWLKVFESVEGLVRYKKFWLSHAPIHPAELRGKSNIHGHVHNNSLRCPVTNEYDERYINVCCEPLGEIPISLDDILSGRYYEIRKC